MTTSLSGGPSEAIQAGRDKGGKSSSMTTQGASKTTHAAPASSAIDSSMPLPPASSMTTPTSSAPAHHISPRLTSSTDYSSPMHAIGNEGRGERQQEKSSSRLLATSSPGGYGIGATGNGLPLPQQAVNSNGSSRMRASTSALPIPSVYSSVHNHPARLNQLPYSAQMAAQAATVAAVAANMASSSHLYRTNGMNANLNLSSSSSPSSSNPMSMQNCFLFHPHFQQQVSYEKHTVELTNCIIAFLSPILPTEEEYRIKEATRRQLERLAGRVSPGAKLLAFGSMANGFALRNSDMDLCCLIASGEQDDSTVSQKTSSLSASQLVEVLGKLIREETDYNVMPLPKARIPIIKISRASTAEVPYEISCDIGFENRLALENTRLLLSYAMVDPPRLRTLVLFLKVWTKRRKLNSPYTGTLSSYGYTLMMIFFLSQVKVPAVLPNLQRMPPSPSSTRSQEVTLNGHDIYFYDDVATLRKEWTSLNSENVGELLIDFFRYFSKEFTFSKDVISIRTEGGLMPKDGHTWSAELCIEDPFQKGYNVARTVTRDGLYTIRGEFMRASRLLTTRSDRVSQALAELCEEREDGLTRAPDTPYYQRQRASIAAATAAANYNQAYEAGGMQDSRYLRDLTKRYDLSSSSASGFGGSFAFEEMARGLGQAQKSSNVMAYPPTTAMLAPLSQNTGLSPRQYLMRAGLRYETPRRGQGGTSMNNGISASNFSGSSTRSEDGSSNYDKKKSKKGSASSNVSARTSPNMDSAIANPFLHPSAAMQSTFGAGDFPGCGSEISFGSERFQLHPQPLSRGNSKEEMVRQEQQQRGSRSFSDGINRSMSLPRPGVDANEKRRSSTPLLSEPASPSNLLASVALPTSKQMYLEPSMASLAIHNGRLVTSSPRSSISGSSGGGGASKGTGMRYSSSQPAHTDYSGAGRGKAQTSQPSLSSPRLPPSPWSFVDHCNHSRDCQSVLTPEEEGSFGLDDDQVSNSDDTLDESLRISAVGSSHEQGSDESSRVVVQAVADGKEHAVRSWAATQSIGLGEETVQLDRATLEG